MAQEQDLRYRRRVERVEGLFPVLTRLRATPRLYAFDGFVAPEEIGELLGLTADLDAWERRGVPVRRDSTGASFELPVCAGRLVADLAGRIELLLGVTNQVGRTMRYRSYGHGEAHPPHADVFTIAGYRLVATAMVILAGPDAGGETEFTVAAPPVRVPAVAGRLVCWLNHLPNGAEDVRSVHASLPVLSGTKTTLTDFIYASPGCDLVRNGPGALS